MNIYIENIRTSPTEEKIFELEVEYFLNESLSAKSTTNEIRQMLRSQSCLDYETFQQTDSSSVFEMIMDMHAEGNATKLRYTSA